MYELLRGALAGALGQTTTLPLSVVVTRQQTQAQHTKDTFWTIAKQIVHEQGWTALWTGLKPSLVLIVNPAITYGFFERLKQLLLTQKRSLNALDIFLIGAIAKAIATILTYPYIMAKVQMQAQDARQAEKRPSDAIGILRHILRRQGILGWYKVPIVRELDISERIY